MSGSSDSQHSQSSPQASSSGLLSNLRVVSFGTLVSRLLGLVRDMAMTALFGAGTVLDAFIVAFRIPNLARQLLGEGALSTAFLPVFLRNRNQHGDRAARETLTAVAVVLSTLLFALVLCCELVLALTAWLSEPSPSTQLLLLLLMIMLPYMLFICVAALLCAALHALRQFFWPMLVPIALNVIWLAGLGVAVQVTELQATQAVIAACCVTLAGGVQLIIPWLALRRTGMGLISSWRAGWPFVADVFRTMLPIVVGMTIVQCSALLDSIIAWGLSRPDDGGAAWCQLLGIQPLLESGTTSALYIGQRMYQFPVGIFGVALGTVLYPLLTQHAQRGEFELLRSDLARGLRILIAVAIPASAGLCLLAWPMTIVLFRHGHFNAEDTRLTSQMIGIYGAGVWSYIGLSILNRAFYATGDRITPMRFGFFALVVNLLLNIVLIWGLGGIGMALASVLASILQVVLLLLRLNRQVGSLDWEPILRTLGKGLIATALMSLACLAVLWSLPPPDSALTKFLLLAVPCTTGMLVYLLSARLLGLSELEDLLRRS